MLLREVERRGPEASHWEDGLLVAEVLCLPAAPEKVDNQRQHEGKDGEADGEADYEPDWVELLWGGGARSGRGRAW